MMANPQMVQAARPRLSQDEVTEARNRAGHAALVEAFVTRPQGAGHSSHAASRPPIGDVPGFAEADQVSLEAIKKLRGINDRLAAAEADRDRAQAKWNALSARVAAGRPVEAGELAPIEAEIHAAEAMIAMVRDAIPAAEQIVKAAETAVSRTLYREAQRLHEVANAEMERARIRMDEARWAFDQAAGEATRASAFLGVCGSRSAWGGQVRGIAAATAEAQPAGPSVDEVLADVTKRGEQHSPEGRNALADAILRRAGREPRC